MFTSKQKSTEKSKRKTKKNRIAYPKFKDGDYVKISNSRTSYHICNPPMHLEDGWYYLIEYGIGNVDSLFIHESKLRK